MARYNGIIPGRYIYIGAHIWMIGVLFLTLLLLPFGVGYLVAVKMKKLFAANVPRHVVEGTEGLPAQ